MKAALDKTVLCIDEETIYVVTLKKFHHVKENTCNEQEVYKSENINPSVVHMFTLLLVYSYFLPFQSLSTVIVASETDKYWLRILPGR